MNNKALLRIAGIISIVFGVLCCLTIIGAIIGVPLLIGGYKFKEISDKEGPETDDEKNTILIWSIVFLFINQLSGILSMIYYILLIIPPLKVSNNNDKFDKLERLKKLYDNKILTKEEYEKEKSKILNN